MTITIEHDTESGMRVPWTLALSLGFLLTGASVVVSSEVFLRVTPGSLVASLVVAAGIVGAVFWCVRRAGVRLEWVEGERLLLATVTVLGFVLATRVFDWPFFAPRGFSVDGAHHGAIVEYVASNLRFAEGTKTSLDRFAQYPNGAHLLAAVGSRVFGTFPVQSMGFLGFICLLMTVQIGGVTASLVTRAGMRRVPVAGANSYAPIVAALSVPVMTFAASRFTIGMLSKDYFFAQLVALTMVAGGVAALVVFSDRQNADPRATPLILLTIGLLSAASTFVYPLQITLLPAAVVLILIVRRNRQWFMASAVCAGSVVAVLAFTIPRLGASRTMAGDEGVIATPRLSELGGLATALFLVEGLLALGASIGFRRRRRDRETASTASGATSVAVLGPFIAAVAQTVGLLVVRNLPGLPTISRYTAYKNVYLAVPFALIIAAVGVGHAWTAIPLLRGRLASSALVALLMLYPFVSATRRSDLTNSSRALISEDSYRLLRDFRNDIGSAPIAILAPDIEPYALSWIALRRPQAAVPNPYLIDRLTLADLPGSGRRFVLVLGRTNYAEVRRSPAMADLVRIGARRDAVLFGPSELAR